MTVKELKEFLENIPDDAKCVVYESHSGFTGRVYWEEGSASYDAENNEVKFS